MRESKLWHRILFLTWGLGLMLCIVSPAVAEEPNLEEVKSLLQRYSYEEMNEELLNLASVPEIIEALADPYTVYINPADTREFLGALESSYFGIGVTLWPVEAKVIVGGTFEGSPAALAGLLFGDVIIKVNGEDVRGLSSTEVAIKMKDKNFAKVELTIQRDEEMKNFVIEKTYLQLPTSDMRYLADNIGYVKLHNFAVASHLGVNQALADFLARDVEMVVLDLRGNTGGRLNEAVNLVGSFTGRGNAVYYQGRNEQIIPIESNQGSVGLPIAVLVDGRSASASEILAGAIQDAGTGFLIGEQTFGKGSVQKIFLLRNGGALKMTTGHYLTKGKQDIDQMGLTPDVEVLDREKQLTVAVNSMEIDYDAYDYQFFDRKRTVYSGLDTGQVMRIAPYIRENGKLMLPVRDVLELMGKKVYWTEGKIIVGDHQENCYLDLEENVYVKNREKYDLTDKLEHFDGFLTIEATTLLEILDYQYRWYPENRSLCLFY